MGLSGKNVVFVGGLGFIGYEACKQIMTKNVASFFVFDVLENAENIKALQAINPKSKVYYTKFDITNKAAIKQALDDVIAKVQYIDVLVNGAGILTDPNVELTMNINLIGLINTTLEAIPLMDKNKNGRGGLIVNIASVLGLEPAPPTAVYCASKFGVMGFSRSISDPYYYNHTGIAVATFCPGLTETPLKNNIATKYTFEYSKEIGQKLNNTKTQKPEACGAHLATVCETGENGGIYISNQGTLSKVTPTVYWQPTFN
uniref:alcohol dehydrogenase n=3 Tax=Zeugodacus cucurbitae TaxID=28588 RepID=Q868N9_ZEUCU|nr:alcohol dehydrogenase [Zeugodacus cucurbitae]CAD32742.1 alcohol dehydrogenase-2 [Zeugodacus cucurbitae]CAD62453.1 alcohol dehydrogenase 2 [Zeugodacus cucurbitae]